MTIAELQMTSSPAKSFAWLMVAKKESTNSVVHLMRLYDALCPYVCPLCLRNGSCGFYFLILQFHFGFMVYLSKINFIGLSPCSITYMMAELPYFPYVPCIPVRGSCSWVLPICCPNALLSIRKDTSTCHVISYTFLFYWIYFLW